MDKKYIKDFGLLLGLVIIVSIIARFMARGETLEEYEKNRKADSGATISASGEESSVNLETVDVESENDELKGTNLKDEKSEMSKNTESATDSVTDKTKDDVEVIAKGADDANVISGEKNTQPVDSESNDSEQSDEPTSSDRISIASSFYYEPLSDETINRITGISYVENDNISLEELRYCSLLYNDFDNNTQVGELICNEKIAQDIIEIFYELYTSGYQIESIKLIDEFGGDDTASMLANNTSCFNYRVVENTTRLSNHAYGLAIDINPFYNPYVTFGKDGSTHISPEGSEAYADRSASFPYKIDENDLAYKLFKQHGFKWGGDWNSVKDYQHFERPN